MKIYVCIKHVPDSAANIIIKERNKFDESVKYVINPYDEIAVEEAVRVRERDGDSEVIAVTLGKQGAINTLRIA
ncbi:MAG: electron transfer flavoprotein subunit beta/FixA family protein, partial [Proteobacteria bacterium]|nr:electron transfer flavoprotein subunit beta/FixA family protein [Pseudomonadota bacterium]